MQVPSKPDNESARLASLLSYHVLDTPNEKPFDDIVKIAAYILDVPTALVSFIDTDRQWFKARYGLDTLETSREISFCGHVVAGGETLIVPNAIEDERFKDNPFVEDPPNVRAYIGVPLRTANDHVLGTLCALDVKPRAFSPQQLEMVSLLADRVMSELELRREIIFRRQFSTAVNHSPYFLALADLNGKPFYLNKTAREWLGLADGAAMPAHIADWHVESMRRYVRENLIAEAGRDGRWAGGTTFIRGGEEVAVDESVHYEAPNDQYPGFVAIGGLARG